MLEEVPANQGGSHHREAYAHVFVKIKYGILDLAVRRPSCVLDSQEIAR
jgi:hypothetical protein